MKKDVIRDDLQDVKPVGKFLHCGAWVTCARDPDSYNLVPVSIEYDESKVDESDIEYLRMGYRDCTWEAKNSQKFVLNVQEIFRTGKWSDFEFTEKDFTDIVANHKKLSRNGRNFIPIQRNHDTYDVEKKCGHIDDLKVIDGKLVPVNFTITNADALDNILRGTWNQISPQFLKNYEMETGGRPVSCGDTWMLYEVSFVPFPRDVKLSLQFSEKQERKVVMPLFGEGGKPIEKNPEDENKDKNLNSDENGEAKNSDDGVNNKGDGVVKNNDEGKKEGESMKDEKNPISSTNAEVLQRLQSLEQENQSLKNDNGKLTEGLQQLIAERSRDKAEKVICNAEADGKLPPAQHENNIKLYLSFSEEQKSLWEENLKTAPVIVQLGEQSSPVDDGLKAKVAEVMARYHGINVGKEAK
jgi:hypothetical protein